MKLDKLVGERFKERPADSVVDSHALMLRGGYIKQVGNGLYSSYTPLKRMEYKVERIIREEMEQIDGQEVRFPVVIPASLYEESGRYYDIGPELMRFADRNDTNMVIGITHEEPAVQLVREYGQSYTKYPFMVYQFQTKLRDEARPRAGLIRVREFVMKDAYSYHTSQEDLDDYYKRAHKAYERIYARVGIPQTISIKADSGMMGGDVAHEFMLLTPIGEDTIVVCEKCDFRANMEAAERISEAAKGSSTNKLEKIATPECKTIEEVCRFLKLPVENSCKAVMYQTTEGAYVVVFIRGDLEVNEVKLSKHLGKEILPAIIHPESGLTAGYTGPHKLSINAASSKILFDRSLEGQTDLCCGANEEGYHYKGLDIERDCGQVSYQDLANVSQGDICPKCQQPALSLSRGIEVGHIFQLGDKYTSTMGMQYTDPAGELHHPLMGCYGIGIGRLISSICEVSHDEHGPIWPMAIAPWQVHLCCFRSDDPETKAAADNMYQQLQSANIEVIYDDRPVRPGVMLSDADLLGTPIKLIISPRNLKENTCEIITRNKSSQLKVPLDNTLKTLHEMIKE